MDPDLAWKSGPFVHRVNGRNVQQPVAGSESTESSALDMENTHPFVCDAAHHAKLKGARRCLGCGRTRNEIELEEG